jgi:outer membrane protein assembly factor BamB/adenine/guanine phosphoribosyltransferase-like PRPP-binding protein
MDKMKQLIIEKVFENEKIKDVSSRSSIYGEINAWVMNFKSVSVQKEFLTTFTHLFTELYKDKVVQVGGMESGALPLIAALSLGSPSVSGSFYVRKARKKHDLSNIYEGEIKKDIPIVLVDDILNRGSTFLKQIQILKDEGFTVSEVFVALKFRDDEYYKELKSSGVKINYIYELDDFKDTLSTENLTTVKRESKIPYDAYERDWAVNLAEQASNMYVVIPKSGLVDDEKHIYTGVDDGTFYCLNKSDGSTKWKYKIAFGVPGKNIFSTPALSERFVFFGAYDGNLYCLDKETGKVNWIFFDADYIGSSPCIESDEYVYIGMEFGLWKKKGGVAKVSIKTGKMVWANYEMMNFTHASPVSNKKLDIVVCGCNDGNVYCFDRSSGKLNWKFEAGEEFKYGVVFDERRKLVIIAGMGGGVYCLNSKDGSLWHKFEGLFGFYSTAVSDNDNIYIGGLDKRVYCFDLRDKQKKWEVVTGGRIFASPVLFEDHVYIGSNDGNLYEIDKVDGKVLSRTIISERIVNRIIIKKEENKKVLYIKSFTNEVYRFVEKDKEK